MGAFAEVLREGGCVVRVDVTYLIHELAERHSLTLDDYESLITNRTQNSAHLLRDLAVREGVCYEV